jgi:hypothetical protein
MSKHLIFTKLHKSVLVNKPVNEIKVNEKHEHDLFLYRKAELFDLRNGKKF